MGYSILSSINIEIKFPFLNDFPIFATRKEIWSGSSVGQSNSLLSCGSQVRILSGSPKRIKMKRRPAEYGRSFHLYQVD